MNTLLVDDINSLETRRLTNATDVPNHQIPEKGFLSIIISKLRQNRQTWFFNTPAELCSNANSVSNNTCR
jgi:hypothetical protein